MIPKLRSARYVRGYIIHVEFDDGQEGDVDLKQELWGEVFEPLKDPKQFRAFQLNEELNTLVWPSGADFAPEYLYDQVTSNRRDATSSVPSGS